MTPPTDWEDGNRLDATDIGRSELIWPSATGGYLAPPSEESWLAGAVTRCRRADLTFPRCGL